MKTVRTAGKTRVKKYVVEHDVRVTDYFMTIVHSYNTPLEAQKEIKELRERGYNGYYYWQDPSESLPAIRCCKDSRYAVRIKIKYEEVYPTDCKPCVYTILYKNWDGSMTKWVTTDKHQFQEADFSVRMEAIQNFVRYSYKGKQDNCIVVEQTEYGASSWLKGIIRKSLDLEPELGFLF